MSWLFGGGSNHSTSKDITPDIFKKLRGPFAGVLQGLLSGGASNPLGGIPKYNGPQGATKPDPNEQALLDQLMQMNGSGGIGGQARDYLSKVLGGGFLPGQGGANPFLDAAIKAAQRTTNEGLTETLTRSLPGRFTQAGQFVQPQGSSAFDRAAAIATRGAANANADIATNMSSGAYEAERGRQQEAVTLQQQQVQSTISNLQAQALPRLIQEYGVERGMQEFQFRISALLQLLGIASGSTGVSIGQNSSGSSTGGILPAITGFLKA